MASLRWSGKRFEGASRLAVLTAACLWGASGTLSVMLFGLDVPPSSVAFYKIGIASLVLLTVCLVVRRDLLRGSPARLVILGGGGGLIIGVFHVAYQLAIEATGVATAAALLYLYPALVVVAAHPLVGERITAKRLTLALLVVTGIWLTALGAKEANVRIDPVGAFWGLLASLAFCSYVVFGRYAVKRFGSMDALVYSTVGGTLLVGLALGVSGHGLIIPTGRNVWLLLAVYATATIPIAQLLFFVALKRLEAGEAAILAGVEPLIAALLAFALVGQGLTAIGWLGIILVTAGAGTAVGPGRRPSQSR